MNKKFKKALYMLGFTLPIVAIPIITVACGTQTSQDTQKETDKNQNEQTPKQETPIQDENKKVVVLSSLSSSKIYDESLLNNDVIELFKLFKQKDILANVKKQINILSENIDSLERLTININQFEKSFIELKTLIHSRLLANGIEGETLIKIIELEQKVKIAAKAADEAAKAAKAAKAADEAAKAADEAAKAADEATKKNNVEEAIIVAAIAEIKAEVKKVKLDAKIDAIAKLKQTEVEAIRKIDESLNEINQKILKFYKKIFLIETSESIDFSELKYNDFLSKFPEIKLSNFFNIENLKKYLQNLNDNNKLSEIILKDIFNTNINSVIESLKKDQNKNIKLLDFKKEQGDKIIELLNKDNLELSNKIKDKLGNLINFESLESLLKDLIFSDLFDVTKLQEKLN